MHQKQPPAKMAVSVVFGVSAAMAVVPIKRVASKAVKRIGNSIM
jgi:hypothetical protein